MFLQRLYGWFVFTIIRICWLRYLCSQLLCVFCIFNSVQKYRLSFSKVAKASVLVTDLGGIANDNPYLMKSLSLCGNWWFDKFVITSFELYGSVKFLLKFFSLFSCVFIINVLFFFTLLGIKFSKSKYSFPVTTFLTSSVIFL